MYYDGISVLYNANDEINEAGIFVRRPKSYTKVPPTRRGGLYLLAGTSGPGTLAEKAHVSGYRQRLLWPYG